MTIREVLIQSYSNLAMAHFALRNDLSTYNKGAFMVRSRLRKGLQTGKMKIASLYDDEKQRLRADRVCVYCGSTERLSLDHLIARTVGGTDSADNLIYACRSCNSSKNNRDLLLWYSVRAEFPPILVLRRYLKLFEAYCSEHNLLDIEVANCSSINIPFRIDLIPLDYPQPEYLRL
jgi:hypothetical protein